MKRSTNKVSLQAVATRMVMALAGCSLFLTTGAHAARLGLAPLLGDGLAGRTTIISGAEFRLAVAVYTVTIRGLGVTPATVSSNVAGVIAPVTLTLPALPAGPQDVVLTGGGRTYTFTGAYQVFRNICLGPVAGNGRAGMAWYQPASPLAGLPGAWTGMVFTVQGWGFASGGTIAANSITLGGSATSHPAIVLSAVGRLNSTTIIVGSNLANGLKDIVINDGAAVTTFANAFTVRRSIGVFPARGINAAGPSSTIIIEGWGFTNTPIAANSILVAGATTIHPAFTPVAGFFTVTVTLTGAPAGSPQPIVTSQETFPTAYHAVGAGANKLGISPETLDGIPNQAFEIQGMGRWANAAVTVNSSATDINSMLIRGPGPDQPVIHPAISAVGGWFPRTWVKVNGPVEVGTTDLQIMELPTTTNVRSRTVAIKSSIFLCPIISGGAPTYTVTLTAFGLSNAKTVAANSITVGGSATTHPMLTESTDGYVSTTTLVVSALSVGDKDVVITDSQPRTFTFASAFHVVRTIGLSFVNGSGAAGELTGLSGNGFTAGAIAANSVVIGAATTHGGITALANGSFAAASLTLPALAPGAYDVAFPASQGSQVFPQAYRVTRLVSVGKHALLPVVLSGTLQTYSFSFTNTGIGDWASGFSILDTVPAGTVYAPGSAASSLPATFDWFSSACSCITAVEPLPANVVWVRWTLIGLLPLGSNGVFSFKVTVQ